MELTIDVTMPLGLKKTREYKLYDDDLAKLAEYVRVLMSNW